MKYLLPPFFCFIILAETCFSQTAQLASNANTYKISGYSVTPPAFKKLLFKNAAIEANDTVNEEILDLVSPIVKDSILGRPKEHHQVFLVGWIIHAFAGYNWRAVSMTKEKFVGTVEHNGRSGAEEYTEYDIKYGLHFHLHKYLWRIFDSYNLELKYHRQDVRGGKHHTNYNAFPYVRDTSNMDTRQLVLGCEVTPARGFRSELNYLFYPTLPGLEQRDHPNIGTDKPSMGVYGVNCLDCNHNCHPELHPYEWIWWLNLHTKNEMEKTWLVGLFHEASNRFSHWSHTPKTGKISIPFAYVISNRSAVPEILVEHLVFDRFMDNELSKFGYPDYAFSPRQNMAVKFENVNGESYMLHVNFNNLLPTDGLKFWFSDINWDEQNHILSGYFNFAASVPELYTARITFKE
jgi:hypothetical protein